MQTFKEFGQFILDNSKHDVSKSNKVHIILNNPKIKWDDYAEYMATLTWWSSIRTSSNGSISSNLIFAETDKDIIDQILPNHKFAIISFIGSFYKDEDYDIHWCFQNFCNSNQPCRGHLIFHPDEPYGYLHPQTIFINLDHWRSIGKPSFSYFSGQVINYVRSIDNVHDDYTPLWVAPGNGYKQVHHQLMAEYISKVLEDGYTIYNFDKERTVKFFCYPKKINKELEIQRLRNPNIIYPLNTDSINLEHFDKYVTNNLKKYDVIYTPASGQVSEVLHKFFSHSTTKLIIFDNNLYALKWKKFIYQFCKSKKDLEKISYHFEKYGCVIDENWRNAKIDDKIFSLREWFDYLVKEVDKEFLHIDIIKDNLPIDPNKSNLIYLSNIFNYSYLMHKMKIKDIHDRFLTYTQLPNTTIMGSNVFKDMILKIN